MSSKYLQAKNPTSGAHKIVDVVVDSSGRLVVVTASGAELDCMVCDDAASGGPYFILSDTDGKPMLANYTALTTSNRVEEIDPLSEHHAEATLADVTDGSDGTYYYYVDMDGYQSGVFQLILHGGTNAVGGNTGCTATLEVSCQDDGTAQASCTYIDATNDLFGVASLVAAPTAGASDLWYFGNFSCKYARIKIVADPNDVDTCDWTIYHKRWY